MTHASAATPQADTTIQAAVLDLVRDGAVLVGTLRTLAEGLGVSVSELRSGLRVLIDAGQIAVHTQSRGQLTIRMERRRSWTPPPLPPAPDRRRPLADIWVL